MNKVLITRDSNFNGSHYIKIWESGTKISKGRDEYASYEYKGYLEPKLSDSFAFQGNNRRYCLFFCEGNIICAQND